VLWTAPGNGETIHSTMVVATDGDVAFYTPRLQIQFSEALDAATVTSTTVQLTANAQPAPVNVQYDPTIDQAVVLLGVAPLPNTDYTVTVSANVADLAGNKLAAPVVWTFHTDALAPPTSDSNVFLPNVQR
jgi:hypothetical protein